MANITVDVHCGSTPSKVVIVEAFSWVAKKSLLCMVMSESEIVVHSE